MVTSLRVLLAEDNPVSQKVAELMLSKLGHRVDTVSNGIEAVRAVHQTAYDVVLMDVQMPMLDGLGATEQIRAGLPAHRQPRVVALSASVLAEDRVASTRAGMDAFLSKPLRLRELDVLLTEMAAHPAQSSIDGTAISRTANGRVDDIWERLMDLAGPEPAEEHELLSKVLRSVAARAPQLLDEIEGSMSENDHDAVADQAHSLKGSVANLGGTELARQLDRIEEQARLGRATEQHAVSRARDELIHLCSSFIAVAEDLDRQAELSPETPCG
jgi:CheY-like chemotaxis protein